MDATELIELQEKHGNLRQASLVAGISYEKARKILVMAGLHPIKITDNDLTALLQKYDEGASIRVLADTFHKQHFEVKKLLELNQDRLKRPLSGQSPLTKELIPLICADYHSRMKASTIREKYHITADAYTRALALGKASKKRRNMAFRCKHCGGAPPDKKFWKARKAECRDCNPKDPDTASERTRNKHYIEKFGITASQYNAIDAAQDKRCAICGLKQGKYTRKHAIDHCHTTGEIRGLLCVNCNTFLGFLEKYESLMGTVYEYLANPPAPAVLATIDEEGQGLLF